MNLPLVFSDLGYHGLLPVLELNLTFSQVQSYFAVSGHKPVVPSDLWLYHCNWIGGI